MTKVAHNIYRQLSSQCVWTTAYRTTSVYRYMKLSVIVIPRISPSTAAAAAQCQQVVPYKNPPFHPTKQQHHHSSCPKNSFNPSSHPPNNSIFSSSFSFSSSILIFYVHPSIFVYLTLLKVPHLTSSSPTPQKKTTLPNASSKPFVSQDPIFPFRLDCSCWWDR